MSEPTDAERAAAREIASIPLPHPDRHEALIECYALVLARHRSRALQAAQNVADQSFTKDRRIAELEREWRPCAECHGWIRYNAAACIYCEHDRLERENAELQRWNQTQRDRIAELRRQLEIVEASNYDRMAKALEYGDAER